MLVAPNALFSHRLCMPCERSGTSDCTQDFECEQEITLRWQNRRLMLGSCWKGLMDLISLGRVSHQTTQDIDHTTPTVAGSIKKQTNIKPHILIDIDGKVGENETPEPNWDKNDQEYRNSWKIKENLGTDGTGFPLVGPPKSNALPGWMGGRGMIILYMRVECCDESNLDSNHGVVVRTGILTTIGRRNCHSCILALYAMRTISTMELLTHN